MDQKEIAIENTPEPMNNSIIIESDVQFRAWNLRLVFIDILKFYQRMPSWAKKISNKNP